MAVEIRYRTIALAVRTVLAVTAFLISVCPAATGARPERAEDIRTAAVISAVEGIPAIQTDTLPAPDTAYILDEVMVVATRTSQEVVPVQMLSGEKLRSLGTHSNQGLRRHRRPQEHQCPQPRQPARGSVLRRGGARQRPERHSGPRPLLPRQHGVGLTLQRPEERHPPVRQGLRLRQRGLPPDQEAPLHRRQAQQLELRTQGRLVHDRQPVGALGT